MFRYKDTPGTIAADVDIILAGIPEIAPCYRDLLRIAEEDAIDVTIGNVGIVDGDIL